MKKVTLTLTLLCSFSLFAAGGGHAGSFKASEPLQITESTLKVAMTDVLSCYGTEIEEEELSQITLGDLRSSFRGNSYAKKIASGPMDIMLHCASISLTESPYQWKIDRHNELDAFTYAIMHGHDGDLYDLNSLTMEELATEWLSTVVRKNIRW